MSVTKFAITLAIFSIIKLVIEYLLKHLLKLYIYFILLKLTFDDIFLELLDM